MIKNCVDESINENENLNWSSSRPSYNQILTICHIACAVYPRKNFGQISPEQLAYFINKLRTSATLKKFILNNDKTYRGKEESIDYIFKFLRSCEYGLPQVFSVIELFAKKRYDTVNYSSFINGLACWFKPALLKELDEEGIPIQISEKFYENESKEDFKRKLLSISKSDNVNLTTFEKKWIQESLEP